MADIRTPLGYAQGVALPLSAELLWEMEMMFARVAAGWLMLVLLSGLSQVSAPAAAAEPGQGISDRYEGLRTSDYLTDLKELHQVQGKVFLEGPAADLAGNCYFSNVPVSHTLLYQADSGKVSVFRENTNLTNGTLFDSQGRLLCCEGGKERITRLDTKTGELEVLADSCNGKPLGAVNDLALDSRGRIYFTARFGTELKDDQVNGVYRINPNGNVTRLLATPEIDMPNGIVISPDEKTLYLIDADPRADHARRIRAYELNSDGSVGQERLLIDFYPGRSGDGMAIDSQGNLYVAAGLHKRRGTSETLDTRPGIHVISPQGELLAFLETPEDTLTNCTFGGKDLKTLYIACGSKLLSVRTKIPGMRIPGETADSRVAP